MSLALPRTLRILLLAAASLLLLACDYRTDSSRPLQVREQMFVWRGQLPAGATVMVREARGGIEAVPSPDDSVRITARMEWRTGDPDRVIRISASQDTDGVLVCATWGNDTCTKDKLTSNVNLSRRRSTDAKVFFTVAVPAGVELDLTAIDADISASSAAPVRARTLNGDIRVATAVGPVRGETMNGSVDIRMTSLTGTDSVIAKTLNGDAFAYLPATVDATADVSVTNGSVATDFAIQGSMNAKRIQGAIGAGGRVVRVHSVNGSVALRKLDAEGRSYP